MRVKQLLHCLAHREELYKLMLSQVPDQEEKKNGKDVGAREIATGAELSHLSCTWPTLDQFPALHTVPQILPAVIPEHRARSQPWGSLGLAQNKSEEEALLIQTPLYRCSASAGGLRDRGLWGRFFYSSMKYFIYSISMIHLRKKSQIKIICLSTLSSNPKERQEFFLPALFTKTKIKKEIPKWSKLFLMQED